MEVEGLTSFAKEYTGAIGSFTPRSLTAEPRVFAGTPIGLFTETPTGMLPSV